jgi:hypothetical protein
MNEPNRDDDYEAMNPQPPDDEAQVEAIVSRDCCRKHWQEDHHVSAMRFGDVLMNPVGMGMMLCKTCGYKRCPRATDCSLECTWSNEPGQKGSIYG